MVTALQVVILIHRFVPGTAAALCFLEELDLATLSSLASLPDLSHLGHAPDGSVPSRTKISLVFQLTDQLSDQLLCHLSVCYRSMALALGPS